MVQQLALKLAPDRKKFMEVIGRTGDINADIEKFCTNFTPLLEENHKFLVSNKVNNFNIAKNKYKIKVNLTTLCLILFKKCLFALQSHLLFRL